MYTNPRASPKNEECRRRVEKLLVDGAQVRAPGIAVYETRRKLTHLQCEQPAAKRLARFDAAVAILGVLPITDEVMHRASEIWGDARHRGICTSPPEALDGDVILVAHAFLEAAAGSQVEIATTNTADLRQLFPNILNWDDLKA
jgi:hypothetical protein